GLPASRSATICSSSSSADSNSMGVAAPASSGALGAFDAADEPARGEPGLDQGAGPDVAGRPDDGLVVGPEGEAVSAGQDGQGAERLGGGGRAGQARGAAVEVGAGGAVQVVRGGVEAGAGLADLRAAGQRDPLGEAAQGPAELGGVGDADLARLAGGQGA